MKRVRGYNTAMLGVKSMQYEPAKRGESIKPEVTRSGTPGTVQNKKASSGRQMVTRHEWVAVLDYRTLRALGSTYL
jgi:hypothetical protein